MYAVLKQNNIVSVSGHPLLSSQLRMREELLRSNTEAHEVLIHKPSSTRDVKMHTMSTGIPAFLTKLWKMTEDPKTNSLISWSPTGKSFIIKNQAMFAKDLLPFYYKHSNMASFIRQLNMYGFHKKVSELGGLKCDKDQIEFVHPYFCKDNPSAMDRIKRKVTSKNQDPSLTSIKPEVVNKMLSEVKNMKDRQENMDSTLNEMKLENATLWRELVMLRQKHMKQQQIINKLIQFLVTLVQPRSGLSVKRPLPLMINDLNRPHKRSKIPKPQERPMGPVIHELDLSEPDVDSDNVAEMLENEIPTVQSPQEHIEALTDDENMETVQLNEDLVQNFKIGTNKKYVCKNKKKEELHMVEISTDEDEPMTVLKKESIRSKPVPMASVRSSKLAAMAANIKSQDVDIDIDTATELEDNIEALDNDASMMKLEDILIVPEIFNNTIQNSVENTEDDNRNLNKTNKKLNQIDDGRSVLVTSNNEQYNENRMVKSLQKEDNSYDRANPSSSKDLSVSCVNSSGMTEANYRLDPIGELDTHVETMQNDLDNLREMFRSKNYNINASTVLELFHADDPMTFGLPINPELNPNCGREDDEHIISDSVNGGELMAYNPSSNSLDFDDDMLLENVPLLSNPSDLQMHNLYASDPLDLEDTKVSLLDDLQNNTKS